MEEQKNGHGGRRDGAGRKAVALERKRVQFCISVDPQTKASLQKIAEERGTNIGKIIDEWTTLAMSKK